MPPRSKTNFSLELPDRDKQVEWKLQQFNLWGAFRTTFTIWEGIFLLLIIVGAILLLLMEMNKRWTYGLGGGIIFMLILLGIILIKKRKLYPAISCLSPRLIFTILSSWLAYPLLATDKLTALHIHGGWWGAAIGIFFLYLYREVAEEVETPHQWKILRRTVGMLSLAVFYVLLIGIITIHETFPSKLKSRTTVTDFLQTGIQDSSLYFTDPHLFSSAFLSLGPNQQTEVINLYRNPDGMLLLPIPDTVRVPMDTVGAFTNYLPLHSPPYNERELKNIHLLEGVKLNRDDWFPFVKKVGRIYLFPYQLLYYGIVVLFFGLFLNLTLKGKRFTGL